jgi:hypothetical protein
MAQTPRDKMPRYTVVVLYPHRVRADHKVQVCHVRGYSANQACVAAVLETMMDQPEEQRGRAEHWKVLCVFNGHANAEHVT